MRILWQGQLYKCVILALTKQNADSRLLEVLLHKAVIIIDIHLHLSEILMGELVCFQVDEDIALQQSVIKDKIYIIVVFIEGETFLAGLKEEALA